ncbi:MAG: phage head closure protein [Lachnospiraceae bacterium]|nr:phage head closure protein [Lachnospiraceae bacterium]
MNNEVLKLITVVGEKRNADGYLIGDKTEETEVFCSVKSVGRTEFYDALRAGRKATVIFVINPDDYEMSKRTITVNGVEKKVRATKTEYEGEEYSIMRSYTVNLSRMELTCEVVE